MRGPPHEQVARVEARGAGRLVGGIVLVEQDEGRGRRQRHEERRARAHDDAGAAAGRREPRRAPSGLGTRRCRAGPRRAAAPIARPPSRSGAITSAAPVSRSGRSASRRLAAMIRPELGPCAGGPAADARAARGLAARAAARAAQGQEGGAPRTRGSPRGPARQLERGPRQHRHRLHRALERLAAPRSLALAERHHHPHPAPALQWRAHPLAAGQPRGPPGTA